MIEGCGKKVIKKAQRDEISEKLGFSEERMRSIEKDLYLNLLTYTKGDANAKVSSGGIKEAMENYRYIHFKGKNATITSLMDRRLRVMHPQEANGLEDIELKMLAWKTDIKFLREMEEEQDLAMLNDDTQMCTIMMNILPEIPRNAMMNKYNDGVTTLEELEEELSGYLLKKSGEKKKGKVNKWHKQKVRIMKKVQRGPQARAGLRRGAQKEETLDQFCSEEATGGRRQG